MSQRHFFFNGHRVPLFGALHAGEGLRSPMGFVFSHAWGEEKLWSHRTFVSLAAALASRGHPVLRFDFTGAGDSHGQALETTLETHVLDLGCAVDALRAASPELRSIGLVGCRLGATIAARFAEAQAALEGSSALADSPMILVDPVCSGEAYLQALLRSNLGVQLAAFGKVVADRNALRRTVLDGGAIDIEGHEIGRGFFESFQDCDLLSPAPKAHAAPTLVLQVAPTADTSLRAELTTLADTYPRGRLMPIAADPFWRETKAFCGRAPGMEAAIMGWLEANAL